MRYGVGKCGVVAPADAPDFTLQGERVPQVTSYTYLGVDINATGVDTTATLGRRVAKTRAAVEKLARTGFSRGGFHCVGCGKHVPSTVSSLVMGH